MVIKAWSSSEKLVEIWNVSCKNNILFIEPWLCSIRHCVYYVLSNMFFNLDDKIGCVTHEHVG